MRILFYYPQHFNRTAEGTNPFFDQLLEVCEKNGIDYELWEEPDGGSPQPRNGKAKKADRFFWFVTALRTIATKFFPTKDFYQKEDYVAKAYNLFTLGRMKRFDRFVTISGSMFQFFARVNPSAKVYDLQHGVVFKEQETFFDQHKLRAQFLRNNLHFLFWGKGYLDCFTRGEVELMDGRVHDIGYPVKQNRRGNLDRMTKRQTILLSLQITNDMTANMFKSMVRTIGEFLDDAEVVGAKVILKHHPRYNNSYDINSLLNAHENVEVTNESLTDLLPKTFLHVTFNSTTAFEFAEYGVPTFFLKFNGEWRGKDLFYEEYSYPLYGGKSFREVWTRIQNVDYYKADREIVKNWYDDFYTEFDEQKFLDALK